MKTTILNCLRTLVISTASLGLFTAATTATAIAQSVQGSDSSGSAAAIFNAQSGFQSTGFQQSDTGSAAVTAGGSASALHQVNSGPLTVSGAPASQPVAKTNSSSVKLWFSVIFFASAIGLILVYFYTKRTAKKQDVAAEDFAESVIVNTKAKSTSKASSVEESETPIKKDKSKKKKKNKKHHR